MPIKAPVAGLSVGLVTAEDLEKHYPVDRHTLHPHPHPSELAVNEHSSIEHTTNEHNSSGNSSSGNAVDEQSASASASDTLVYKDSVFDTTTTSSSTSSGQLTTQPSYALLTDIIGTEGRTMRQWGTGHCLNQNNANPIYPN